MRIFGGCDGGGTKCEVHVCAYDDRGQRTNSGIAIGGSANVRSAPEVALSNTVQTTLDALKDAELPADSKINSFVAALAGAGTADIQQEWASRLAASLNVDSVQVLPDAAILFSAADVESAAVATVIGTGSIIWSRSSDGNLTRAGGLGPFQGDEGSAFWIGREITLALLRGELPERLHKALAQHASLAWLRHGSVLEPSDIDSVFPKRMSQCELASLAPLVFEFANVDRCAANILSRGSAHLASQIRTATSRQTSTPGQPLSWVCAGSVAQNQSDYLGSIRKATSILGTELALPTIVDRPASGALKLAQEYETKS